MTKLRFIFPAVAVGASLALAACSGLNAPQSPDQSQYQQPTTQQGGNQGQGGTTSAKENYTTDQLSEAFTNLGYTKQSGQPAGAMLTGGVQPQECQAAFQQVTGSTKDASNSVVASKNSGETTLAGSAHAYDSAQDAASTLDQQTETLQKCADVTMNVAGQKVDAHFATESATVAGAESALKTTMTITGLPVDAVSIYSAVKGNALVSMTGFTVSGQGGSKGSGDGGGQGSASGPDTQSRSSLEDYLAELG